LTGGFRVSLTASATAPLSAKAAGVPSASEGLGVFPSLGPAGNATPGASVLSRTSLADRFAAFPAGLGLSPSSNALLDAALSDARSALGGSASESLGATRTDALIERHPGLRSTLGFTLFDNESDFVGPVASMRVNLDALDALFAQMAEDDSTGK
jgi:hypothetical protein